MPRLPAVLLLSLAAVLACAGPGADSGETGPPPRPTRGYVLVSLDTLRADHLGTYGYPRPTSPFLDELARRAVVFERATVQYPSTLTSHMSIFTGLYPAEHGVYPPDSVLSREIETLPEAFRRSGFRTGGYTEGGFVHGRFGFKRGFDAFAARDRRGEDDVEHTFERAARFLRELGPDEPFFLFVHTYAVHAPYEPPADYRRLFWEGEAPADAIAPTGPELSRHNATGELLRDEVRDYLVALYDAEIRRLDDVLRRFFAELESLGLAADTTVVVTADHGEEFQEHGRVNHTQLYDEILHVPLLVVHPDLAGRRVTAPVQSIDLAPTLYELARIAPRTPPSGRSLVPFLEGHDPAGWTTAYAEVKGDVFALYQADGEGLHHFLVHEPRPEAWATRRLRLDTTGGRLAFEVLSFGVPRRLAAVVGGETVAELVAGTEWTPVELELPELWPKATLELRSPDCTAAGDDGKGYRCFSFRVRGIATGRTELFDVLADPAESADVSSRRFELTRELYARLRELRQRTGAATTSEELDAELRKELESLGYLQ